VSDKRQVQNFIDGKSVDAADGRRLDLVDPTTGEVFGSSPISGAEDVDRAFAAGHDAVRAAESDVEVRRRDRGAR
jgi:betaine-aldehyde dehydrogenase